MKDAVDKPLDGRQNRDKIGKAYRLAFVMQIQFQFNVSKAIGAMVMLIDRLGSMDKLKLIKLLYFMDRDCFLQHGHPVTGDKSVAMDHGPVQSACLNVLNGDIPSNIFQFLHLRDREVSRNNLGLPIRVQFSSDETAVIEQVIKTYGGLTTAQLYHRVHELPEYKESYVAGTSTLIPFSKILQHYGTEDQFRHGRPVITAKMREYLDCPFPDSES